MVGKISLNRLFKLLMNYNYFSSWVALTIKCSGFWERTSGWIHNESL